MRPFLFSLLVSASLAAVPVRAISVTDGPNPSIAAAQASTAANEQNPDSNSVPPPVQPTSPVLKISEETHHELLLHNDFANVYELNVPAKDKTLPFIQEFPSVTVTVTAGDIQIGFNGKAPALTAQKIGDVTFSIGGTPQTLEVTGDKTYRAVVVELLQPQGNAKNLCQQAVAGPLDCAKLSSQQPASTPLANGPTRRTAANVNGQSEQRNLQSGNSGDVPAFETDGLRADLIRVSSGHDYSESKPIKNALLVALANSNLSVELGGQSGALLHDGDVLWMPAGKERRVTDFLAGTSSFVVISFRAAPEK